MVFTWIRKIFASIIPASLFHIEFGSRMDLARTHSVFLLDGQLPVTGYSSFLHQLQLASHDITAIYYIFKEVREI